MDKAALVSHLAGLLAERATALRDELAATLEARNIDTKSSAGDKHEVGRAMVQQELDQLEAQLAKTQAMQQELARVQLDIAPEQVSFGSLVATDRGTCFIAIGLGAVEVGGKACFVISLASPLGQALRGKRTGEALIFQGEGMTIQALT